MENFFLRIAHVCFALGLIVLAAVGIVSYRSLTAFHHTVDTTTRSLVIQAKINDVRNPLKDAESSHRGYLLTGQRGFLEKFQSSVNVVEPRVDELEALLAGNREALGIMSQLKPLISAKIDGMKKSVKTMRRGRPAVARALVHSNNDKKYMDRIVTLLDTIDNSQLRGYQKESLEIKQRSISSKVLVSIGGILAFAIVSMASYFFQLESRRRERIESDLRKARELALQASQLKSEFLANVSHEIRTPLNGIVGTAEILESSECLSLQDRKYVETLRGSGDTLLRIINDILDFSKIEAGKLDLVIKNFSPKQLVESAVELFAPRAQQKGIRLSLAIDPKVPPLLQGDAERISQILFNLIANAVKFTEQGLVAVELNFEPDPDSLNPRLHFSVRDTGIGLSRKAMDRLFMPFTQGDAQISRQYGGTGLGLSISKRLVELMKGRIEVSSIEGKGSIFSFTIPLFNPVPNSVAPDLTDITRKVLKKAVPSRIRSAARPGGDGRVTETVPGQRAFVLVAEDDLANQMIARTHLEKLGCTVHMVSDGTEVLKAVRKHSYHFILMDCQMPKLDGFDTVRALRSADSDNFSKIPVIAMTANAMVGDREKCLAAGMDDYVSKPVKREDLAKILERWGPSDVPLVDVSVLEKLAEQTTKSLAHRVIMLYLDNLPSHLTRIEEAVKRNDPTAVQHSAHALKSSSAGLGARALYEICARIENSEKDSSVSEAMKLLPVIHRTAEAVQGQLEVQLLRYSGA